MNIEHRTSNIERQMTVEEKEKMNIELAIGEHALVRLRRVERLITPQLERLEEKR